VVLVFRRDRLRGALVIREITDEQMKEYADGVGGQAVANLVFTFMYLDIGRPNMFDLFMLMCVKDKYLKEAK
jgi:hypothetical protein